MDVSRRGDLALKLLSGAEDATWPGEDRLLAKAHREALTSAVDACMRALENGILPGPKKVLRPVSGELSIPLLLAIREELEGYGCKRLVCATQLSSVFEGALLRIC